MTVKDPMWEPYYIMSDTYGFQVVQDKPVKQKDGSYEVQPVSEGVHCSTPATAVRHILKLKVFNSEVEYTWKEFRKVVQEWYHNFHVKIARETFYQQIERRNSQQRRDRDSPGAGDAETHRDGEGSQRGAVV